MADRKLCVCICITDYRHSCRMNVLDLGGNSHCHYLSLRLVVVHRTTFLNYFLYKQGSSHPSKNRVLKRWLNTDFGVSAITSSQWYSSIYLGLVPRFLHRRIKLFPSIKEKHHVSEQRYGGLLASSSTSRIPDNGNF